MTAFTQTQLKRLMAVHGWSGTVLGLLLYAVVLTGIVVVFAHELEVWSIGGTSHSHPFGPGLDAKVRPFIDKMSKGYQREISINDGIRGELTVFPHANVLNSATGWNEAYGSMFILNADTGELLQRRDGFVYHDTHWYVDSALEHFLVDLHVQLYVPSPWGLILTGVLGLLMISTGISGLILHRHMIRDLFVPERSGQRLVSFRDRHVLAGTWGLIFAFLLGFTGAYFSFSGTVVYPLLLETAFGGDQDKASETLYAPLVMSDPSSARLASLDEMIADSTMRAGAPVNFISIKNYGRRDAVVRIYHPAPSGELVYKQTVYDGTTGAFQYFKPDVGRLPSSGSLINGLMWPLHTGDFAGVLSKAVWVGLGSAMAFVVISGLRLWVRRREDEPLWQRFGRAVTVVGYGLPVAMLMCAYAYFLALGAAADEFWWTPAGFLIGLTPGVVPGFVARDEDSLRRFYRLLLGIGLILLPVVRMATGGLDWATAIAQGQGTVLSVDLTLLLLGAGLVWWARRMHALPTPEPTPAE
ncbi:PepSY-associated TM helix domain-containing protein [Hwanghaeella sp. 1Z406]|jgi:uncharacterized iron-regulated membrane protein|uniref:PepSY-associated TM helix domain-containing protein n=1 Tax=Hwanghaeella sp. 1Z406 TaxID=3402811 RepID=UPI0026A1D9AA|tara:strand:- start:37999 stop:39579 length:1581 start_codon:yes stop_codon:yes gene_type:complete